VKDGGAVVSQIFSGRSYEFAEYVFSNDFTRLQSVSIEKNNSHHIFPGELIVPIFAMDRIRASIIPIPPAIWLMGSALLALLGLRRRRA
ncbi:MAG: hypothetical protein ACR2QG_04820, partial [Gammaproteobacteria bacterium]